jgi:hypothetical protein
MSSRIGRIATGAAAFISAWVAAAVPAPARIETQPPPPPDAVTVREVQAGGAQVYACRSTASGQFAWTLVGPKAVLINADGSDFGTHSAGPTWTATDGSSVSADGAHPLAKIERPRSVPALLLKVVSSQGQGILTAVRFVRRADTEGGAAPPTGCDAEHADATAAVRYSAVYTFYR